VDNEQTNADVEERQPYIKPALERQADWDLATGSDPGPST
jgi:hypothetical protein